jgi:hypothetical protein
MGGMREGRCSGIQYRVVDTDTPIQGTCIRRLTAGATSQQELAPVAATAAYKDDGDQYARLEEPLGGGQHASKL